MLDPSYIANLTGSLTLTEQGSWLHDGKPFTNQKVIEAFDRSIVWNAEKKCFMIEIGNARAFFTCEDTAFFVRDLVVDGGFARIRISDGTSEPLDLASLSIGPAGQFYCTLQRGFPARFNRASHQKILEFAQDEESLLIGGTLVKPLRRS